ncbi:MAG: gamma-glutamyltransferase [Pseudomonadota bacterium]
MVKSLIRHSLACAAALAVLFFIGAAKPVFASAAVASAHPLATRAGIEVLEMGGNAFDAAIAVSAALAVVEPSGSGLGGGGFWLLHDANSGQQVMLDGREKAPLAADRDMYLDADGNVIDKASVDGPLSAGIPGAPAALVWLAANKGVLPLSSSLARAIRYAEEGFITGEHYKRLMTFRKPVMEQFADSRQIFMPGGDVPEPGSRIVQTDLANTLRQIAQHGHDGFYGGQVAEKLVAGVRAAGGIWSMEDMTSYEVKLRAPIVSEYRGMQITSAAPPSSGGLVMATAFNILSAYDLDSMSSSEQIHLVSEALRRAYRDRAEYMGDSDFVDIPFDMLTSPRYADGLRQSIRLDRATSSDSLAPTRDEVPGGEDTTHFSVIDQSGNRVAATLSINYPFGSGFVAPGTGVLLNDEMDDFSAKPGEPNVYGLVGAEANSIQPGKRMLSSMSPTFLETDDRLAIVGTPGGSRIITMVFLAALAFHDDASAEQMVNLPRYHHQYLPDRIQHEPGAISTDDMERLRAKGHTLHDRGRTWGNMHAIVVDKNSALVTAASDARGEGKAIVLP